ncbi:MAG: hypothetical protein JNL74_17210 [Fibrobacteres bacterium]|nr:hypothetical protein [Fibrobacterota bacterium]
MDSKLQELTQKLYAEGVEKGEAQAKSVLAEAQNNAAKIIADAKAQAASLLEKASKEAEELKHRTESEIRLAGQQSLAAVRQNLEEVVSFKALSNPVTAALSDSSLLKDVIKALIEKWNPKEAGLPPLEVVLPESKKSELEKALAAEIAKALSSGVKVQFSKAVKSGFQVQAGNGGFKVGFTEADFLEFFRQALKPATRGFLFNS